MIEVKTSKYNMEHKGIYAKYSLLFAAVYSAKYAICEKSSLLIIWERHAYTVDRYKVCNKDLTFSLQCMNVSLCN